VRDPPAHAAVGRDADADRGGAALGRPAGATGGRENARPTRPIVAGTENTEVMIGHGQLTGRSLLPENRD
jgi:hypothetical protein